jgi:hypothetical protein
MPPRLATDGVFDPPHPAASRARLASPIASATPRRGTRWRFTPRRKAEPSKTPLKRCARGGHA